ncbi:MAG: response regulator [Planctomycetota bacterium]|jgi:DNA-binding NarL/FixJ family response regulator
MNLKILIAEDHLIVREGLHALINRQDDMEIVGEADNGKAAIELAKELKPDVIIMDVSMPGMNGIEATRQIKTEMPDIKVIALSAYDNREYVMGMVKAGVSGYLLKDCAFEELIGAIRTVLQNKSYLSPDAATIVLEAQSEIQSSSGNTAHNATLSEPDRELIELIVKGKTAREIAEKNNLSIKTIEGRRRRIMKKLNINNTAELVKYAIREGVVSD